MGTQGDAVGTTYTEDHRPVQPGVTGLLEVTVDRWPSRLPIQRPPPSGCIMLDLTRHMRQMRASLVPGGHA
jgi:hypothetical protein